MGSTWTWRRRELSAGTRGGPWSLSPSTRRRRALEAEAEGSGSGQVRSAGNGGVRGEEREGEEGRRGSRAWSGRCAVGDGERGSGDAALDK